MQRLLLCSPTGIALSFLFFFSDCCLGAVMVFSIWTCLQSDAMFDTHRLLSSPSDFDAHAQAAYLGHQLSACGNSPACRKEVEQEAVGRGKTDRLSRYNIHELVRGAETISQGQMRQSCAARSLQLEQRIHGLKASLKLESVSRHLFARCMKSPAVCCCSTTWLVALPVPICCALAHSPACCSSSSSTMAEHRIP